MATDRQIKSIEKGSGISWNDWLKFLAPHKDLDHTNMAAKALEHIREAGNSTSPEWWAQGVTVAYEQHIGRRQTGERCDGSFSATVSKTLPIDKDGALELLRHQADQAPEFAGVPRDGQPRVSSTEKWRYWRINLADESKVSINIQDKPGGKSVVAINHDGLTTNENLSELKQWWKMFLDKLANNARA